jgi:hypothetical protein
MSRDTRVRQMNVKLTPESVDHACRVAELLDIKRHDHADRVGCSGP